ncbi:DegT/DnrJ/EryC1/StrS family aminotransferase [Synergistaceae bacterium OttesenSCG-928-I11]|nr:DegT/DnrJ/EryC1/StrS family aminotransferase [Synergistaceae bacterium OttesenSCG-928-I11]
MFVPVNEPDLSGNEKKYLQECIDTGWISSEGPFVERFEQGMADLCKRRHAISVANGSVALDLAMQALELELGSEVIMPTFTIISCASAIVRAGCIPVLVDSDPLTWNMDVSQIESKISSKTSAIMVVHIYGLPVDMRPILNLAKKYGLKVIEDAAEAIGQTYYGEPCGSFGDISCFSFYPNKHITTGEGGMVLCNDDKLSERCRSLRNLCFLPARRFMHERLGYNFRMSNLQAAVGMAQLERLEETINKKRDIGRKYQGLFASVSNLQLPIEKTSYAENIYWVFGLILKDCLHVDADDFAQRLKALGVATRPFFWPMHEQPVFLNQKLFEKENHPVSEAISRKGFYLPSGVGITEDQIVYATSEVKKVLMVIQ